MTEELITTMTESDTKVELICFTLEKQEFGISINQVKEIIQPPQITTVIHTPHIIEGVINVRGIIIAVLNLKNLFNFEDTIEKENCKIVIIHHEERCAGVLVDTVEIVKQIDKSQITQLENKNDGSIDYYMGVTQLDNHPLTLLNIEKIITSNSLAEFQEN